jgi:hypothetical protein
MRPEVQLQSDSTAPSYHLPDWLSPYVAFIALLSGTVIIELPQGSTEWKICRVVLTVATAYGAVSGGWVKKRR